jgi:endonuclease/exonuclease/phosphatase family metal-dependent hydrolase
MPIFVLLIWLPLSGLLNLFIASEPIASFRRTVGPPVVFAPAEPETSDDSSGRLIVVNWNVHVGHGDVAGLVGEISSAERIAGFGEPEFVFLLEESFRRGHEIPDSTGFNVPRRIAPPDRAMDIEDLARKLQWWMYYAPSMRNGDDAGEMAEDRGNAILSSLPLEDVAAIELPFVVQRRVALVATVTNNQRQPKLRVAVTHFDTRAPLARGWIFGGPAARTSQAKGLVSAFHQFDAEPMPLVVGGDLNTYLGSKAVIDAVSELAPRTDCGDDATHASGLTLDHIFARVPEQWSPNCSRAASTMGSDHYPLVLRLDVSWTGDGAKFRERKTRLRRTADTPLAASTPH